MKKYTSSAKSSDNKGKWCVVDADGAILGRLATTIASRLRGKHNPFFTPHVDTGDSVIVINAEKDCSYWEKNGVRNIIIDIVVILGASK